MCQNSGVFRSSSRIMCNWTWSVTTNVLPTRITTSQGSALQSILMWLIFVKFVSSSSRPRQYIQKRDFRSVLNRIWSFRSIKKQWFHERWRRIPSSNFSDKMDFYELLSVVVWKIIKMMICSIVIPVWIIYIRVWAVNDEESSFSRIRFDHDYF